MLLYLKNCGRGIDYKMEKSQKIEKMTNLMTSQSDDDVIGATSNLSEDTCQSIIFHIWGRSCLYLIRCCLNNSHKMCAKISCIYLSIYLSIYQRQKQSLSYASPLVVYWDPVHDHSWNDKVCHESLSQCQSNLSSSSKLKNSIFGVVKVN